MPNVPEESHPSCRASKGVSPSGSPLKDSGLAFWKRKPLPSFSCFCPFRKVRRGPKSYCILSDAMRGSKRWKEGKSEREGEKTRVREVKERVQLASHLGAIEWPDLGNYTGQTESKMGNTVLCIREHRRGLYTRETCSYMLRVSKVGKKVGEEGSGWHRETRGDAESIETRRQ